MGIKSALSAMVTGAPRFLPMGDKKAFYDACRKGVMAPALSGDEVSGTDAILYAMAGTPLSWCAYALATAWHETAHTMQPIKERGGPTYYTRMYDVRGNRAELARSMGNTAPGDGAQFCGRGYVQLTWKVNYERAAKETGYPLVGNPDIVMRRDIAATILRKGMTEGWFTGKSFANFLPTDGRNGTREQFVNCRRIINGADKAALIAQYALGFQDALNAGGWA